MKGDLEDIRRQIAELVEKYYNAAFTPRDFIGGKSAIPVAGRVFDEQELQLLTDSALDFWLTSGRFAAEFEKEFAVFTGIRHQIPVNSGSSANLLAVSALMSGVLGSRRLQKGDEVITVAAGFPTTVGPIIQNGLVPVFVDIDLPSYNANPDLVKNAVTEKTRAVILAHTLGNPVNLDRIKETADKYCLWLIEDCCDALGSQYRGRKVGRFGDIATFSFYPAHHITMGEGGCVATDNDTLKTVLRSLRDWGRDCWCDPGADNSCGKRFDGRFGELPSGYDHKYVYSHFGYNLKITDMQAAIGVAQLKKLPMFIESRKKNWKALRDGLAGLSEYFILPEPEPDSDPSWFGFLLTVREGAGFSREQLVRDLESQGVRTRMLFAGNMLKQPCFDEMRKSEKGFRVAGELAVTEQVMNNTFWIGVYPGLTDEMISYVLDTIIKFISKIQSGKEPR
jgi:CDP-4-dehydro-6-deoxyglucose reductase, E1